MKVYKILIFHCTAGTFHVVKFMCLMTESL